MVGDGPERSKAEALCRETCSFEDTRFLGKLDHVEEVLSVADLFLMPSEKESFGLAALEAMACEVPVVSSNTGGLTELNIDGVSGFTCDIGDIESMTKKSLHILKDENLPSFKEGALKRAKEFDITNILPMYESFYNKIVESFKISAV